MPIDPSIPLGVQPANPMTNLSQLMGIATQRQQLSNLQAAQQAQQIQNTDNQISLQERQNLQPLLSDPRNWTDPTTGDADFSKLVPAVMHAAPTTGAQVLTNLAQMQQNRTHAKMLISQQTDENNARVGSAIASLPQDASGDDVEKTFSVIKSLYPSQDMQNVLTNMQGKLQMALQNPKPEMRTFAIQHIARMFLPQPTQQQMATPGGPIINNGARTYQVSTTPGTAVPTGQVVPGTDTPLQPGPNTQTIGSDGTQGIVGTPQASFTGLQGSGRNAALADIASTDPDPNNRREASNVLANRPQGFIPQSLPAGAAQNISNNVDEMNRHFASLNDQASGAQLVEGLTGNIKSLAAGAATGTEAGRKAYVVGLLNALHLGNQATGDLQKDTDLLEKNMAQLNLATPASSDAARALVSAARPHGTMQEGAITEAADQVAGQVKANMAMRNALQGYKMMGDTQGYANARQKLEQVADPRAWQYEALGPGSPAAKAFVDRLTPSDKAALGSKIQQLEQMGMFK